MNDLEKRVQDKLGKKPMALSGQEQDALWESIATQLDADARANDRRFRRRIAGSIAAVVVAFVWFLYPVVESQTVPKEYQKQAHASVVSKSEALSVRLAQSADVVGDLPAIDAKSGSNLGATTNATKKPAASARPSIVVNDRSPLSTPTAFIKTQFIAPTEMLGMDELIFMERQPPRIGYPSPGPERAPMKALYDEINSQNIGHSCLFNIRLYQGPTWSKFSYLEQGRAELTASNDNMKSGESWGGGGMIEFGALRQRWGVGVERDEFIHKLTYNGTFEEVNTIDNALLQVELDPNTGDTLSSVIGPAEVLVLLQRRVIHHNRLRTVTIPMEWQKRWSVTSTFDLGIALGALVHWRTQLSGRTFTEQEGSFMDYSDSEFPSNRISVGPMLRMHAAWDIAPDWSVQLSGRISSMTYGSRPASALPDQNGQFKGRLVIGNLSFGVARALW
jgi:hypothetical protein